MSDLDIRDSDRFRDDAVDAIEHAIDASGNKDDCEAWYEAIESVLLWQCPENMNDISDALRFVRYAIDERFGDD